MFVVIVVLFPVDCYGGDKFKVPQSVFFVRAFNRVFFATQKVAGDRLDFSTEPFFLFFYKAVLRKSFKLV